MSAQIHSARTGRAVEGRRSVLKEGFLPLVEERGMDLVLVADGGDGLPLDEVQPQEADFFFGAVLPAGAFGGCGWGVLYSRGFFPIVA